MMWLLIGAGVCVVFLAGFLTCAVLAVGARADECAECERTMAAAVKAGTAVAMDDILMLMGAEGWAPPRHADPALRTPLCGTR
jgi:hypothetical protein